MIPLGGNIVMTMKMDGCTGHICDAAFAGKTQEDFDRIKWELEEVMTRIEINYLMRQRERSETGDEAGTSAG